jgi:hypothetical protein
MSETTTWYAIKRNYRRDAPFIIVPLTVVSRTTKTIMVRDAWEASKWRDAGYKDSRRRIDGDVFEDRNVANAEVQIRL